jgi:hypothetical protein
MRHRTPRVFATAALVTLAAAGTAAGSDLSYTYLRGGAAGVDVDTSANVANPKKELVGEVSTDSDTAYYLGASWEIANRWHVFADYQEGGQDVTLKGTGSDGVGGIVDVDRGGDFNLTRFRVGVGYVKPMSQRWDLYGRLSLDYAEADNVGFTSIPANADRGLPGEPGIPGDDEDDYGFGAEIGARMALWRSLDGTAWVRYTSVGDLGFGEDFSAEFDDDVLGGVQLHWLIGNKFGLEAGYEYGEIATWTVGARFGL